MNLWFTEDITIVPGYRLQVKVKSTLHSEQSRYQKIDMLETEAYGRMLLLDGVIMTTEFDEHAYHEMIIHVPMFAHPAPRKILIIGGGDGGAVREAIRHPVVEEVHMCELDERVVEVCREYLPGHTSGLDDPRVHLHYEDGYQWVRDRKNEYDVIMVDSTDPVGPGEVLFQKPFYEACRDALKEDGIMVNQAENAYYHWNLIRGLIENGKTLFPIASWYYTIIPTYPGGHIGFTFFSRKYGPMDNLEKRVQESPFLDQLKYWTPGIQSGAFQLPADARKKIFG